MSLPSLDPSRPERRLERLAGVVFREPIDAFYVSALPNIRYLSGFTGSAGHLLVEPHRTTLFVDGRYREQAAEQAEGKAEVVVAAADPLAELLGALGKRRLKRIGFESARLTFDRVERLRAARLRPVPLAGRVENLRAVKSAAEIEAIRRSVALNDAVFEAVAARLRSTWTESRLAAEIDHEARRRGASGPAFDTIVASGPHGALPHAMPRPVRIARKSLIVLDHGVILDGYTSDMTRMLALGNPPVEELEMVDAVLEAQAAAKVRIRAGVRASSVDRAAREVLKRRRMAELFVHSTGHGLGLEIHEGPRLGQRDTTRLKEGMVVTIEPGVYRAGEAGVRIEDVVVVGKTGCETLTQTPRELRVI